MFAEAQRQDYSRAQMAGGVLGAAAGEIKAAQSPIQRAVTRLQSNLSSLEGNVQHLQRQLEPVLYQQPPEVASRNSALAPVPDPNSPVGYSIESLADRVAELSRVLTTLSEQITA